MGAFPFIGVFVKRREDKDGHAATYSAETVNRRDFEYLPTKNPPDPIRDSNFQGIGRPWVAPFIQRAFTFNIASTLGIMEEDFHYGKVPGVFVSGIPRGVQLPVGLRANIARPSTGTYGDQSAVAASGSFVGAFRNPVYSPGGFVYDFGR